MLKHIKNKAIANQTFDGNSPLFQFFESNNIFFDNFDDDDENDPEEFPDYCKRAGGKLFNTLIFSFYKIFILILHLI